MILKDYTHTHIKIEQQSTNRKLASFCYYNSTHISMS